MANRQYELKKESIESIDSLSELAKVTLLILDNLKMTRPQIESKDFIKATVVMPGLGSQQLGFVLLDEFSDFDANKIELIIDTLQKKQRANIYSKLYVVSKSYISRGTIGKIHKAAESEMIEFWDRDELINKIDTLYPDFWRHADQELVAYEKNYTEELHDDWSFGRIKQFKASYEKLYNIFIEPKIFQKVKDKESNGQALVSANIDKIKQCQHPVIIEGDSGSGKTRLIREVGHSYIKDNSTRKERKFLPVFISVTKLIDTKNVSGKASLAEAILSKFSIVYENETVENLLRRYVIVIMIDSIDEMDIDSKKSVLEEAGQYIKKGAKLILGTRTQPSDIPGISAVEKIEEFVINKFNSKQVKQFLAKYFAKNAGHADDLIQSLQENKILERLPITPLNLSLISILYEENNFEIPATITDIYDNFNNLLLGRATVDSRLQFFDISIKERILSKYALELLERNEEKAMTKEEFSKFFHDFFEPIAGTIKIEMLPYLLEHLISSIGILHLEEDKYVRFRHDSYLEYYASREIFFYRRNEYEPKLVENFLDLSWQYSAIFYAGRTKDSPDFLSQIISRAARASTVAEAWKGVSGLGYISQALYLTQDQMRKRAIDVALDLSILSLDGMKKLGANEAAFFKKLTLPMVTIISTMWFMDSFNSITVKAPLTMQFNELLEVFQLDEKSVNGVDKLRDDVRNTIAFKLFSLALTLSNKRLGDASKMEELLFRTNLLYDPLYSDLLTFGTEIAGSKEMYKIKDAALKPLQNKRSKPTFFIPNSVVNIISQKPAGQLRFTDYDRISPIKKVRIFTEGKTDAQIIEHAYSVLTGELPYWSIKPIGMKEGNSSGAAALGAMLNTANNLIDSDDEIVIGVFDNDDKGCQEFNGLRKEQFTPWNNSLRVKKSITSNIYSIKLPVPYSKEFYIQPEQRYNLFAIEHYFSEDFLRQNNMIEQAPITGTFRISGNKTNFVKSVLTCYDKSVFSDFQFLFRQIDEITGMDSQDYEQ